MGKPQKSGNNFLDFLHPLLHQFSMSTKRNEMRAKELALARAHRLSEE